MKYMPKEYREPCSGFSPSINEPVPLQGEVTGTSGFLLLGSSTDKFGLSFSMIPFSTKILGFFNVLNKCIYRVMNMTDWDSLYFLVLVFSFCDL